MNKDENYWDNLMGTDESAANYMYSYGEGPGCETRMIIGEFINDGESVLDVGCGPGWNWDHFMQYGPKIKAYVGLDLSPRFVKVANKRTELDLFKVGDARKLRQGNESFDVVILQDILEHTNTFKEPVTEALRVAKKRVIVCFWRTMEGVVTKVNDDRDKGTDGYGADINKDDWEDFLDELGYFWVTTETSPKANRQHTYYVIDKKESL